jgi:iron(III) transport system substrate-binding protein
MNTPSLSRRTLLAALAGTALPLTSAFAQSEVSGQVVLYTTLNDESVSTATDIAHKVLPKVTLSAVNGGSGQLLKRMQAEAAKPQGDVFWTSSANLMDQFSQLFEPYDSPEGAAIPKELHDPRKLWIAANVHVVVAMLNTKRLAGPAPQSWADLTDPRFKGKIIIADPGNSSTAFTALWGIDQVLGADGLKKLAANTTVSSAASDVVRSVGQGEYAVGITLESTAFPYVAGGQKEIKLMYPADGTFSVTDNMALIKNAPHPAAAKRVYDFLLSKQVQISLLQNAFRRPSRSDIDVSQYVDMPPLSKIKILPTDEAKAAAGSAAFLARWQADVAAGRS